MSVSVNGVAIAEAAILAEMQYHPAPIREAAWREAATAMVLRELLLRQARIENFDDEVEDTAIDRLLTAAVQVPCADEAECRRYYENNRRRFRSSDLAEARHILIAAPPDEAQARAAARGRAEELLAAVERDPAAFGALARANSDCPSAANDGHLGQIARGSSVPEFETYLFSLDEGETCAAPIETRYGFHVLRLARRIEGREPTFETVRESVAHYLNVTARETATRQYLRLLVGHARIVGLDLEGADSALVQ
jgi:peptidyl-prolyl cis-trans isomerase C